MRLNSLKSTLINPFYFFCFFWLAIIIAYSLHLSSLYKPTNIYLFYLFAFSFFFLVTYVAAGLSAKKRISSLVCNFGLFISNKRSMTVLNKANTVFFILGISAGFFLLIKNGATVLLQNKVNKVQSGAGGLDHYLGYIKDLLTYQIAISYVLFYKSTTRLHKVKYILMIMVSVLVVGMNLNRGAFTYPLVTIVFFRFLISVRVERFLVVSFVLLSLFIYMFGFVGDLRMEFVLENILKTTIDHLYGMQGYPSWFVWFYIYSTSSLENFQNMLLVQNVTEHSYGLLLFFPFSQVLFKPFDVNAGIYAKELYPYLESVAGLNVSTFMHHAVIDFGYIGPFVYTSFMLAFLYVTTFFAAKNIFGFFALTMSINMVVWSCFVNPFAVGPFVIGWLIFVVLSFTSRRIQVMPLC